MIPECPTCGGTMHPVPFPKKNPKGPDYLCDDRNCKNDKGFPSGAWKPKAKVNKAMEDFEQSLEETARKIDQNDARAYNKEVGEQMNRSNLAAAWIQSSRPIDAKTIPTIEKLEKYVVREVKAPEPQQFVEQGPVEPDEEISSEDIPF